MRRSSRLYSTPPGARYGQARHCTRSEKCRDLESLRLFHAQGKWCSVQWASCQRDVPKSCKLKAAPAPSAGKHYAFHSILVVRARFGPPWTDAYFRIATPFAGSRATVKSGGKAIDGDVPDQWSKLTDRRSQAREETYDEHAVGANFVCRWPDHRGAHKRRYRPAGRETR